MKIINGTHKNDVKNQGILQQLIATNKNLQIYFGISKKKKSEYYQLIVSREQGLIIKHYHQGI
jgi:hypothetical protein